MEFSFGNQVLDVERRELRQPDQRPYLQRFRPEYFVPDRSRLLLARRLHDKALGACSEWPIKA
jgi:hypothetical protein